MKLGIKESTEMLTFIVGLGVSVAKSVSDGDVGITDAPNFIGPLISAGPAFAGAGQIPAEAADYDAEETASLLALIGEKFKIGEEKIEFAVKQGFFVMAELHKLVQHLKA